MHKKNHMIEYIVILIFAFLIMSIFAYVSNTADSKAYKAVLIEKELNKDDIDVVALYNITMERYEAQEKITFTESTPRYLLYGLVVNFIWIAMISIELSKKYSQETMYGDSEWGTIKQIKNLSARNRKIYFTNYPPLSFLFRSVVYFRMFNQTWKKRKRVD